MTDTLRLALVHLTRDDPTQTFGRAHAERLPCEVHVVHGDGRSPGYLDGEPLHLDGKRGELLRLARRAAGHARGLDVDAEEITRPYRAAFRRCRCDVVLAEFGPVAVQAMQACRELDLPLIAHFHGYDAHSRPVIDVYRERYHALFRQAAALVVVSRPMRAALIALGAPPANVHYVQNGVDVDRFNPGTPEIAPPVLLAVGRFVDKKAPQLTILAFREVHRRHPEARLRMIGDGELLGACRDLVKGLCLDGAVTFLGVQPHEVVAAEMRSARAFVQHSIVAGNGDSEGMPNAVLEAGACALPVVATRHAAIPDVVVDGETGLLVDEHDVEAMTAQMERLVVDPELAAELGRAGRRRVEERFTREASIARLWAVVRAAAGRERAG